MLLVSVDRPATLCHKAVDEAGVVAQHDQVGVHAVMQEDVVDLGRAGADDKGTDAETIQPLASEYVEANR